jgi:hypothetical protein
VCPAHPDYHSTPAPSGPGAGVLLRKTSRVLRACKVTLSVSRLPMLIHHHSFRCARTATKTARTSARRGRATAAGAARARR